MARDRNQDGWVEESGKRKKVWRGHYYIYVRDDGGTLVRKHRNITLGPKAELRKWEAEKKLRSIIDGEVACNSARPDSSVTFAWFWENRFLPLQVKWRNSTRDSITYVMKTHVLRQFGEIPLASLKRFDLQTYLNELAKSYSHSLVAKARTWIRAVLAEAVEQEFLNRNPAGKLSMPDTMGTCKRFLTAAEYHAVLGALHGRDRIIFRLFVLCALRPGELFALRWKSFKGEALKIEEAVYRGKLGRPKTRGSASIVIVPKSLAQDLDQWYEDSGCPDPDAFIFPSAVGKPLDAHNYLRRDVLRPAALSAGVEGITFQCLRRTFATHLHLIGTVKDQQSQMRHANAQTTMNVYTQVVSESLRQAMESLDRKLSGVLNRSEPKSKGKEQLNA